MDTGRQWLCRLVSFWGPGERIWRFSLFSLVCILCLPRRPVHCVFEWQCQLEVKCECLNGLQDENNGLYSPFKMEKSLTSSPIALTICLAYTAESYSYPIQSLPVSRYFLFSCYTSSSLEVKCPLCLEQTWRSPFTVSSMAFVLKGHYQMASI